jgi:hypothetical protein
MYPSVTLLHLHSAPHSTTFIARKNKTQTQIFTRSHGRRCYLFVLLIVVLDYKYARYYGTCLPKKQVPWLHSTRVDAVTCTLTCTFLFIILVGTEKRRTVHSRDAGDTQTLSREYPWITGRKLWSVITIIFHSLFFRLSSCRRSTRQAYYGSTSTRYKYLYEVSYWESGTYPVCELSGMFV